MEGVGRLGGQLRRKERKRSGGLYEVYGEGMLSNLDIIDMLENEGSVDFLLLEYGLEPEQVEDETLADLLAEVRPILHEIHEILDIARKDFDDEDDD